MALTLPLNIPIPQSAAIASFNYTDIAEGTGIVKFYGAVHNEAGVANFYLTTNTPYSDQIVLSGAVTSTAAAERLRNDTFSVTFNRPQNIKGKVYLNITIGGNLLSGWDNVERVGVSGAEIQKYDGITATTLATVSGASMLFGGVQAQSRVCLMEFDLSSSTTHFKAGDSLRLLIPLWAWSGYNNGSGTHIGYGVDPQDRNDPVALTVKDTDTTKLELYVPFLLNTV